MSRTTAVLAAVTALLIPATAEAAPGQLAHETDPTTGGGVLVVSSYSPAEGPLTWEQCLPGAACAPFDDGDAEPGKLAVGDPPAGTTFRLTQGGTVLPSAAWNGPLYVVAAPAFWGSASVGSRVGVWGATWSGGWKVERSRLQLQACPSPAADQGCVVLFDDTLYGTCATGPARVVPARYEGWWLRAADERTSQQLPRPAIGYTRPEAIPPLTASRRVAVSPGVRIGPGWMDVAECGANYVDPGPPGAGPGYVDPGYVDPGPPTTKGAAKPKVTVPTRIARDARRRFVAAKITCASRCRVEVRVSQGRRGFTVRRTLRKGTTPVTLPAAQVRRHLRSGKVRVRVKVGGSVVVTRSVTLRR